MQLDSNKKLRAAMKEIGLSMTRKADETAHINDIIKTLSDDTGYDKSVLRKLGKHMHKMDMSDASDEFDQITELHSQLTGS